VAAVWNRTGRYIFALWFLLLLSSIFFFFPHHLSGHRVDVYDTSTHGVAGLSANLECRSEKCGARGSLEIQDAKMMQKIAISAPSHKLSGCIFAIKARIDNRKEFVKHQYLLYMSS